MVEGQEPPTPPVEETVDIVDVEEGSGEVAGTGAKCTMSYTGTLKEDVTREMVTLISLFFLRRCHLSQ